MPGGLMQLNYAASAQAEYIFGNPQITFWKAAYRRHSNFAMESKEISDMSTAPVFGETVTYTIARDTADLIHKIYFETTLPNPTSTRVWCPYPGEKLLKKMSLNIGGVAIETHYSDWLHIWNELSQTPGHSAGYAEMVGNVPALTQIYYANKSGFFYRLENNIKSLFNYNSFPEKIKKIFRFLKKIYFKIFLKKKRFKNFN